MRRSKATASATDFMKLKVWFQSSTWAWSKALLSSLSAIVLCCGWMTSGEENRVYILARNLLFGPVMHASFFKKKLSQHYYRSIHCVGTVSYTFCVIATVLKLCALVSSRKPSY